MNEFIKKIEIEDFEVKSIKEDGEEKFYITGYANTKNKPDAYGDIPKGESVYDLKRFKSNPVLLVDHINSAGNIAGIFTQIKEDNKGLAFKARLMNLDDIHNPVVKHAVSAYMKGFGRGLSIGGQWFYEDDRNPKYLTKAIIHEISLVAVGADGNALTNTAKPKKYQEPENDNAL